jgi:glucose-1-phosphate thymidylyltransferase
MTKRKKIKGIVLAGGSATRLLPSTRVTSKQLLPVYDRPMIFYPLNTLIKAGIDDILVIVSPEHSGDFMIMLGDIFEDYGIKISFKIQSEPRGLPEAFILGENHIDNNCVALILGDNIFEDDFSKIIKEFQSGGRIFVRKVPDPERFGVVKIGKNGKPVKIVEKPTKLISNYAATGLYLYDEKVVEVAKKLKPSERGELEIVDLHNWYLRRGELEVTIFDGEWLDAGTHDSLLEAGLIVRDKKINENFHPLINDAIGNFCEKYKTLIKKRLI